MGTYCEALQQLKSFQASGATRPMQWRREQLQSLRALPLHFTPCIESKFEWLRRLMSFHRPFLQQLLARYDDVDILMGKPLPTAAVRQVLMESPHQRLAQVQWLVDGEERLQQLLALAQERELCLRINVEINVGIVAHQAGQLQVLWRRQNLPFQLRQLARLVRLL